MSINSFLQKVTQIEKGKFHITVWIPMGLGWIENVRVIFNNICECRLNYTCKDEERACFEGDVFLPTIAICNYYILFVANGRHLIANKQGITDNRNSNTQSNWWKLSVNFKTPDWAKNAVMYHVFVDRFAKSKDVIMQETPYRNIHVNWNEEPVIGANSEREWNIDFYGGNLKGIEEKLDYIKSLGTTIIYLSPIVKSQSNHRYDTGDYEIVDPYVGTNEDLKSLCEKAHEKGIYVILDAVFNHTGNDSKYFNQYGTYNNLGAFQSNQSQYYPFYRKKPNGEFDYWWGMKNLPVCDGNSQEWKNYILGEGGVIDKWFSLGIDGLRLDVADELTDEFIMGIREAVHRNKPNGLIIGEVWKNPMRMGRGYISSGLGMDTVMDYPIVDAMVRYYKYSDMWKLSNTIQEVLSEYPDETIECLMNFTSTHDISRIVDILGCNCFNQYSEWGWNLQNSDLDWLKNYKISQEDYERGKKILKSYITALAFMPGMFSIFYGDEVGLEGIGNLLNRRPYPWEKEDKELLEVFKQIGKLKSTNDFLKKADLRVVQLDTQKLMYERYTDQEGMLIIASRENQTIEISLPENYRDSEVVFQLENCDKEHLAPYGAIVLKNKKEGSLDTS